MHVHGNDNQLNQMFSSRRDQSHSEDMNSVDHQNLLNTWIGDHSDVTVDHDCIRIDGAVVPHQSCQGCQRRSVHKRTDCWE